MPKIVNLAALEAVQHVVEWPAGQQHAVRAVTPRIAEVIELAGQSEGAAKLRLFYDAVALLVPTMARADVDNLSAPQVLRVLELSREQVAVVEAAAEPVKESTDPNGAAAASDPLTAATPSANLS